MKSVPVVAFDYRPSRVLIGALAIGSMAAIAAFFLTAMPLAARMIVGVLTAIYFFIAILRLRRNAPMRVAWHSAGHWRLVDANGNEFGAELRDATVRGEWIVLNLRRGDKEIIHLVLLPDNSAADVRRQLRVRLSRGTASARA